MRAPPAPARDPTRPNTAAGTAGSAPAAARTEAPPLAREQPLERPPGHPQRREAVRQQAARQEVPELLLHEGGQAHAVRLTAGRLEEGVEMLADYAIEHGVLCIA